MYDYIYCSTAYTVITVMHVPGPCVTCDPCSTFGDPVARTGSRSRQVVLDASLVFLVFNGHFISFQCSNSDFHLGKY